MDEVTALAVQVNGALVVGGRLASRGVGVRTKIGETTHCNCVCMRGGGGGGRGEGF